MLDVLRGLAVLIVVLSHAGNERRDVIPFLHLHGTGKMGVWLFFVLSAFLLTGKLVEAFGAGRERPEAALARYAVNRAFRIFPLYLLVVVLHAWWLGEAGEESPWRFLWRHALLLEGRREFWVIPVEVKYYAVIPLFCLLHVFVWRRRFAVAAAVLGGLSLFCVWQWSLGATEKNSLLLWPYVPIFAVGSLLAVMPQELFRRWGSPRAALAALVLLLLPLFFVLGHSRIVTVDRIYAASPLLALLWSSVLAWGVLRDQGAALCRAAEPLRGLGRISFSVYLLHYPILLALRDASLLPAAAVGIVSFASALIMACLTWRFVEEPCIRMGRIWGDRIGTKGRVDDVDGITAR